MSTDTKTMYMALELIAIAKDATRAELITEDVLRKIIEQATTKAKVTP